MTIPAIAPPESEPPEVDGEDVDEGLGVCVAEAAVFCDEDGLMDVCSGDVEDGILLLSGAPEIVDIEPR